MALIRNPILFSKQFKVDPARIAKLGILDPTLNVDTKLFIDPLLLKHSSHKIIRSNATKCFQAHFSKIIKLLKHSNAAEDLPWRNAVKFFDFREIKETCLGYGGQSIHGNAIGKKLRQRLMHTAKQIVDLGMIIFFVLMPFALKKSKHRFVRHFLADRYSVLVLICGIVVSKSAHLFNDMGMSLNGVDISNISEFRELATYYLCMLYYWEVLVKRRWGSEAVVEACVASDECSGDS